MANFIISDNRTDVINIATSDQVNVLYTGEITTSASSIVSAGTSNIIQVYGSVRSSEGTAIILNDKSAAYLAGIVEGKTGGIQIGAMDSGETVTNLGSIAASQGVAVSGSGRLNVTNGAISSKDALISGKDFGILFANGSGDDSNLKVTNYGTIRAITGIGGSASNDVVVNYGTIEGTGGIAVSLGAGNDIYRGLSNGDSVGVALGTIDMGEGDDTVFVGRGTDVFKGGNGVDTVVFSGNRSDYTVAYTNGSFLISDKRVGGDGNDTAMEVEFFRFSDGLFKAADLVSHDPTDPGSGSSSDTGSGAIDRTLIGTKGRDTLVGGAGNDKIYGKSGNDILTGLAGQDRFVFDTKLGKGTTKNTLNTKVNFDTITDFNVVDDTLCLDNAIFKKLGKGTMLSPGKLNKKFFKLGEAKDKNDYIIYKKGIVYYDADGSDTEYRPVKFIKVANKANLSAADFMIV